ncbi:MAG: hypothetical protein CME61_07575, partial [Halobacteriovoraceae bacterium]|nr:hypothetical protein [Halobacteriovoraceae bacterium]
MNRNLIFSLTLFLITGVAFCNEKDDLYSEVQCYLDLNLPTTIIPKSEGIVTVAGKRAGKEGFKKGYYVYKQNDVDKTTDVQFFYQPEDNGSFKLQVFGGAMSLPGKKNYKKINILPKDETPGVNKEKEEKEEKEEKKKKKKGVTPSVEAFDARDEDSKAELRKKLMNEIGKIHFEDETRFKEKARKKSEDSVQRKKTVLDEIVQIKKAHNLLTLKTLEKCRDNINDEELKETIRDKIKKLD